MSATALLADLGHKSRMNAANLTRTQHGSDVCGGLDSPVLQKEQIASFIFVAMATKDAADGFSAGDILVVRHIIDFFRRGDEICQSPAALPA